jgi:hypothetical protein
VSFAELAASMRQEELAARARRGPSLPPRPPLEVAVLEDAASRLGKPGTRDHPNQVVKDALRAAGLPTQGRSDNPTTTAVWRAVGQLMRAQHPDWPDSGCLLRLCETEGVAALHELLLEAAGELQKRRLAPPAMRGR